MTTYNFDEIIERRGTDSGKWNAYDPDVIPMFVADMDFRSPEPVIEALRARVEHGVFGYGMWFPRESFVAALQERYQRLYGWQIEPEWVVYLPNLVSGIYISARAVGEAGDHVLLHTPAYWPFLSGVEQGQRVLDMLPLTQVNNGATMRYEIDFEAFEAAITPQTKLFLLCNPHNPVGRVYERWELEKLSEICLRHGVVICSDEIHSDLIMPGYQHIPLATLSPEARANSITLCAASKTYNLPGLGLGYAIIPDEKLREQFKAVYAGMGVHPGIIGFTATEAAYRHGGEWLGQLLTYLEENRDFAVAYIRDNFPGVRVTVPEGTYLLWLDFRESRLKEEPYAFFLREARVALSGNWEPQQFDGCVRLNFGCSRAQLEEALNRLCAAYSRVE